MILLGFELTQCNASTARMPAHRLNLTRNSSALLCLSMILHPPEGGPTKDGCYSVSNLSLILIPHICMNQLLNRFKISKFD